MDSAASLSQSVYEQLLARFIDGSTQPGTMFDRRSIAKELGVSIAPVAEALQRLEQDGFVVSIPRKGTMLRANNARSLYEGLVMREALETEAVRLLFPNLMAYKDELLKLAKAADRANSKARKDADRKFHQAIIDAAGIEALSVQYKRICLNLMFDELHLLDLRSSAPADAHQTLLNDLLQAKTAAQATERMSKHLRQSREPLFAKFNKP